MTGPTSMDVLHSRIWDEVPEANDPFTAQAAYCSGYDVYGELIEKASYPEYLHLLFNGERPSKEAARTLEILAIAIGNPGPRDPSVHAAMSAGVGGSPAASALMAALAVGAGVSGGAREVRACMDNLLDCADNLDKWQHALAHFKPATGSRMQVWPDAEHPPGFSPHGKRTATPVRQTLSALAAIAGNKASTWLTDQHDALEKMTGKCLAMPFVIGAALTDLGLSPDAGEMLTLLLRLPGAAAHALEQKRGGIKQFPFFSLDIENDPGPSQKGTLR